MTDKIRGYFIFYRSFKEGISELSDSDRLLMYEAISDYALDRVEPTLTGFPKMLFKLIKPQLDASLRRWENGCNGGAPKGNKNAKKQPKNNLESIENQSTSLIKDKDKVKDKEENTKKEKTEKKKSQSMTEDELVFHNGMKEKYPNVMKMKEPLTLEQWNKLKDEFGKETIIAKLEAMENYRPLLQKNNSANKTIRNWLRRDNNKI